MKIRIEDLTNEQLDEWVARAQGWERRHLAGNKSWPENWFKDKSAHCEVLQYHPTTNPAQCFELILEFNIDITWLLTYNVRTQPMKILGAPQFVEKREDLCIAICRAVIASVYGEYVETNDE